MSGHWADEGGWTDHEISIGLPAVFKFGHWPGDEEEYGVKKTENLLNKRHSFLASAFELELNKSISPLTTHVAVERKIVRKLIQYGANIAIHRYGRMESLPRRYQLLAQSQDCLALMLRDFFLRSEKMTLSPELNTRITNITNTLAKKDPNKIAYQRVAELRDFIHDEINLAKGPGSYLRSDREAMRLLLSTSRLHLCLNELIKHSSLDFTTLQKRYIGLIAAESVFPTSNTLPGRKNIHRWRLRHYRSLLYYFPLEIRHALELSIKRQGIFSGTCSTGLREYKEASVMYCKQCVENYLVRKEITKNNGRNKNGPSGMWGVPL